MRVYLLLIITFLLGCAYKSMSQQLETVIQRGHYGPIKSVAFTPNGKYLLTGSKDNTIKLWDFESGREIRTYFGHTATVKDIAITSDGLHFVSGSEDGTAKLWEIVSGKIIRTYETPKTQLNKVALSNDDQMLFTGGYSWKGYIWNLQTGDTIRSFRTDADHSMGYGISADFSKNGKYLAIGNDNNTTTIFDVQSGEQMGQNQPKNHSCAGCATKVQYSQDGQLLVMAPNRQPIQIQDLETNEGFSIDTQLPHYEAIDIQFDNSAILILGEDSLKVYEWPQKTLLYAIALEYEKSATDAVFSPDGKQIVIVSDDQSINIYDAFTGQLIKKMGGYLVNQDKGGLDYDPNSRWDYYIKKYTDLKNDFAISPDGKYLAKGKIGNVVRLWDIKSGTLIREFIGHEKAIITLVFTPDGKQLITGSADRTIRIWDVATGKQLTILKGHRDVIFSLNVNQENNQIISGSWDGTAKRWNLNTGELIKSYNFSQASPYKIDFFKSDLYAIVASLDEKLSLYEMDSGTPAREFIGHSDVISSFAVTPDQQNVASVSWDGRLKFWNVATGLQEWRLNFNVPLYSVCYNKNGNQLAVGSNDRVIRIVDPNTKQVTKKLKGHQAAVTNLSFSDDNEYLISSSEDGMIKIWDTESGQEIITYIILNGKDWMVISPKGYFNGTPDAFDKVAFVDGMKSYSASQFFEKYYEPDLLEKVFNKSSKNHLHINEQIKKSPPPKIDILTPHQGETLKSGKASVLIRIIDQGGGIDEIILMNNGKAVPIENQVQKGNTIVVNQEIELVPGKNEISAIAFSQGRVQSDIKKVSIQMEGRLSSTLYLLSIGINKYKNTDLNLNYAVADASGFSDIISHKSKKLFERIEAISLINEEASREKILTTLDLLAKRAKPQDVLFFYYAGHGSMSDSEFYFIPSDNIKLYHKDKLAKDAINAYEIQSKLKSIAALKQVLFIDACQSGSGVEVLAERGSEEEKALAQLARSTGTHVLASAGSEQAAVEFKELGHGIFTYVLLKALNGDADGAPKDGKITVYELKSFLEDQVPEYSRKYKGKMQFPNSFSHGHDFPIVID
ncbi:caspase family protein [Fulvivirga sediminis]|uniref:Caspase family protein n=1 Tax=Fulvivirga sediminis TaxID=2803949 RepID=A0A937F625_9BACT|nr:caspase family protein [Fulvivirga sediminis]MBL3654678.1 caspase family protein [Fulvivirga sediminis]